MENDKKLEQEQKFKNECKQLIKDREPKPAPDLLKVEKVEILDL